MAEMIPNYMLLKSLVHLHDSFEDIFMDCFFFLCNDRL
jgi:hypothetical protein